MDLAVIIPSLITLFTLMIIGYICGKIGFSNPEFTSQLSALLLRAILPIKIFCSIVQPFELSMLLNSLLIFILQLAIYILSHIIALGITKVAKVQSDVKGIWLYALTFPNASFMGFPILLALLGADGLFYGSIANIAFNIYSFSAGIYMYMTDKKHSINLKDLAKIIYTNPVNIAVALGLIFFIFSIPIPDMLSDSLNSFGDMTTPLSMFILGAILSTTSIRAAVTSKNAYIINAFRLIILPLIFGLLLLPLPIDLILKQVLVTIVAMPTATLTLIFAQKYNANTQFAATTLFISNVLCIGTIPLLLILLF